MNLGKETEQIEFKKSPLGLRGGMESIASILNKHASGDLYLGVCPDGEVVGQDIGEDAPPGESGGRQSHSPHHPSLDWRVSKLLPWDEWFSEMRLEDMDETALWDFVNRGRQNGWVFSRLKTSRGT